MADDRETLTPAAPEELTETIAFALCFEGRKRVHHADDVMAHITARRLVEHLRRSGFVVLRKPPITSHSTPPLRNP